MEKNITGLKKSSKIKEVMGRLVENKTAMVDFSHLWGALFRRDCLRRTV